MDINTYKQCMYDIQKAKEKIKTITNNLKNVEAIEISHSFVLNAQTTPKQLIYALSILKNNLESSKLLKYEQECKIIENKINTLFSINEQIKQLKEGQTYLDKLSNLSIKIYNNLSGYDRLQLETYPEQPTI